MRHGRKLGLPPQGRHWRAQAACLGLALALWGLPAGPGAWAQAAAAPASGESASTATAGLEVSEQRRLQRFSDLLLLTKQNPDAAWTEIDRELAQSPLGSLQQLQWLLLQGEHSLQQQAWPRLKAVSDTLRAHQGPHKAVAEFLAAYLENGRVYRLEGPAPALKGSDALNASRPKALPLWADIPTTTLRVWILRFAGRYEQASSLAIRNIEAADRSGVERWRAATRLDLVAVHHDTSQMDLARTHLKQALEWTQGIQAIDQLARSYSYQGMLATSADAHEGMQAARTALNLARQHRLKGDAVLYAANLADAYMHLGRDADMYQVSKEALDLARELGNPRAEIVALVNLGLAEIALGRVAQGKRHVAQSIAMETAAGDRNGLANTYHDLGRQLEKIGDSAGAVAAYHEARRIKDDLLRLETQAVLLEQQARFDAQQQERELQLLKRQGLLQEALLHQTQLQQWLWRLLAVLLTVCLGWAALAVLKARTRTRQLKGVNRALRDSSEKDALTGLSNRRHVHNLSSRDAHFTHPQGSLLLLDLDFFKRVNDRYGHAAGDAVLVAAAQRMRQVLRDGDLLVRWGGEEFLLVVTEQQRTAIRALAARLMQALGDEPVPFGEHRIELRASVGYATFPIKPHHLELSWETALGLVDAALYLAKTSGRNRACGVEALNESDESQWPRVAGNLPLAHSQGDVALHWIEGPPRLRAEVEEREA
jgi:diguanylate cyclase (GGDEF)-like protein